MRMRANKMLELARQFPNFEERGLDDNSRMDCKNCGKPRV